MTQQDLAALDDFNSIKVRLKRTAAPLRHRREAFQFHKGTIKTCDECRNTYRNEISIP